MASTAKRPRFLRPSDDSAGNLSEEKATFGDEIASVLSTIMPSHLSLSQQRERLPVFKLRNHFLYLMEQYQSLVIVGETGSGKSTQLPQYLLESGWLSGESGEVMAVTQPRRVAAVGVAARIAEERDVDVGEEVGYAMRFENCTKPGVTAIKVVTEGTLLRELLQDPLLRHYRVVMLDEAHERSINLDCLLALLKKVLKKRGGDLKLIVSSATLEAELFRDFLGGPTECAVLSVQGRPQPVDVHYLEEPAPCYLKCCTKTAIELHAMHPADQGILIFLPGQEDVLSVTRELIDYNRGELAQKKKASTICMKVLPLYAGLPHREQMLVMQRSPPHLRKIIVATNIAETSVTLPAIVHVIDAGLVKIKALHPDTGLECLITTPISKASAKQRAGRAGRTRPGRVYRLYTDTFHASLAEFSPPEMLRCDLSPAVLQLKALGISNLVRFHFLTPPVPTSLARAVELLYALGAVDDRCHLTSPVGMRMSEMPLHPMASKMLLAAAELGCTQEAAGIAALMQINNIFLSPSGRKKEAEAAQRVFFCEQGDHISQLNVLAAFVQHLQDDSSGRKKESASSWCGRHFVNYKGLQRAHQLQDKIRHFLHRFQLPWTSCQGDVDLVLKALIKGFFAQAAYLAPGSRHYVTIRGQFTLHLHSSSCLFMEPSWPRCVLFTDISVAGRHCMQNITAVQPEWLHQLAPHYYQFGTEKEVCERGLSEMLATT